MKLKQLHGQHFSRHCPCVAQQSVNFDDVVFCSVIKPKKWNVMGVSGPISQCRVSSEPVGKFIPRPVAGPKDLGECPKIKNVIMMVDSDQFALIINHQAGRGTRRCLTDVGCPPCQTQPLSSAHNNICLLLFHRSPKPAKIINGLGPHRGGDHSQGGSHVLGQHTKDLHPEIFDVGRVKVEWVVICKCPRVGTNKDSTIAPIRLSCSLQREMGYNYLRVVTHLSQDCNQSTDGWLGHRQVGLGSHGIHMVPVLLIDYDHAPVYGAANRILARNDCQDSLA